MKTNFRNTNSGGKNVSDNQPKPEEYIHTHKDGTIWAKGQTINSLKTGYWEWYRKDGSLMRTGYFEADEQVGEWTTYDKDGKVVKVTKMKPKAK
jgi:antitoxin component YwqK of YwqJK toxin-antitoxin module